MYSIADPQLDLPAFKLLVPGSHLYKWLLCLGIELYQGLFDGQDLISPRKDNRGVGTQAGTYKGGIGLVQGALDLELDSSVLVNSLRGYIIQHRVEDLVLYGPHGDFQWQVLFYLSHLALVDLAFEDHPVHIGQGCQGGSFVEVVALYHLVPYFHRYIQHHSIDGGTDHGVGRTP